MFFSFFHPPDKFDKLNKRRVKAQPLDTNGMEKSITKAR
jgi:hypothetical protein